MLRSARQPRDMDQPGFRLHLLRGEYQDQRSVAVSGNWRIVFRFEAGEAMAVDFESDASPKSLHSVRGHVHGRRPAGGDIGDEPSGDRPQRQAQVSVAECEERLGKLG